MLGEKDRSIEERFEVLAEVNPAPHVSIEVEVTPDEAKALQDAMAELTGWRSAEGWIHLGIDEVLLRWLGEATGESRSSLLQRLALEMERQFPPGWFQES